MRLEENRFGQVNGNCTTGFLNLCCARNGVILEGSQYFGATSSSAHLLKFYDVKWRLAKKDWDGMRQMNCNSRQMFCIWVVRSLLMLPKHLGF